MMMSEQVARKISFLIYDEEHVIRGVGIDRSEHKATCIDFASTVNTICKY